MSEKLKTFLESSIQGNIIGAVDVIKEELDERLKMARQLIESEVYQSLGFKLNESDDEDDDESEEKEKKDEDDESEEEDEKDED